jgi:hypothetical protein
VVQSSERCAEGFDGCAVAMGQHCNGTRVRANS